MSENNMNKKTVNMEKENIYSKMTISVGTLDVIITAGIVLLIALIVLSV